MTHLELSQFDQKTIDYVLGWFETHPEDWPESYELFLQFCKDSRELAIESSEDVNNEL
jgi:hypothetical protein